LAVAREWVKDEGCTYLCVEPVLVPAETRVMNALVSLLEYTSEKVVGSQYAQHN
jgi:hypothetical protein